MRLADGTLWPIPITLDVTDEVAQGLETGSRLALRDPEGVMLAVLTVGDLWQPDREAEASNVFGTTDPTHPGVGHLLNRSNPWYVGRAIEGIQMPIHYDYTELRAHPRPGTRRVRPSGVDRSGRLPDP